MFNLIGGLNLEGKDWTMLAVWCVVIVLAIIIESQTVDFVSIWFAAGGVFGFVLAIFKVDIYIQFVVAAGVSLVLVLATRPFIKKLTNNDETKTNADKLVGMVAIVTKTIIPNEKGEVKVNYQEWTAITYGDKSFAVGQKVFIKEITGNKVVVGEIEEIEIK